MNGEPHILIDLAPTQDAIPTGETVPLRIVVSRPAERVGPVSIPFINHSEAHTVRLDTDLFQPGVTLQPGESYAVTLGVLFFRPGPAQMSDFYVQITPPLEHSALVRFPERVLRIVPSFTGKLHVDLHRICRYEHGAKVEVNLAYNGETVWENFEFDIGPESELLAGVRRHRRVHLEPGWAECFEVVIKGEFVELTFRGTAAGERVETKRLLAIPTTETTANDHHPFTFLEPRSLSHDRITVEPTDGGREILSQHGLYPLIGGGREYKVTVYPSHSQASNVNLLRAAGVVEVESMKSEGGAWSFLITTTSNSLLTTPVRLYYDVQVPERVLRGEIHLAIHPNNVKLWTVAATLGVALTIKGGAGAFQALLNPEGDDLFAGITELRPFDLLQLLSIPVFRVLLSILDMIASPFRLS